MIVIVGVGHVFDIANQVRKIILEERPDVVGVELDPDRYQALLHPQDRSDAQLTYRVLASFQRRLAHQYGGEVGSEMIAATTAAGEIRAEVLFIDANAATLFRRLWKEMPIREKVLLGVSAFSSMFLSRERVEEELENFTENEDAYLEQMGQQFPTLKRMLIDDRNEIMAKRIDMAASRYPTVLAVVGDGHVEGIVRLLDRHDVKIFRLKEIREEGQEGAAGVAEQSNAQARFHFEQSLH